MRPIGLHVVSIIALLAICFTICATGYQIAFRDAQIQNDVVQQVDSLLRQKRQVETFDDGDFSAPQQEAPEETSFWDRVVRVAIKLFSKFVEWLNN